MRVAVAGKGIVSLEDREVPRPGPGDVLVGMRACGICGSDLEKVYGDYGWVNRRLGHEPAGEVIEVGSEVTDVKPGDRVFAHHHVPCYECRYCRKGDFTVCPHYATSNLDPCGLAEQFLVPEWHRTRGGVIVLPEEVTFEEAAMIEPLGCCVNALTRGRFAKDDSLAVVGAGPTGLLHVLVAQVFGASRIFAVEVNDFRLDFARKTGVDLAIHAEQDPAGKIRKATEGRGADVVVVATGSEAAFDQSLDIVRDGGTVVLFGVAPKDRTVPVDLSRLLTREIRIVPSLAASDQDTKRAFELIADRQLDVKPLITHRFPLGRAADAFRSAHDAKDAMKIVVTA